ncbi:SGNH/GDSL hydrolase family protein [Bradyrhizobium japonicum]|uniref:SGNH/GDSL hydrolase family protein n=1 Tax=Bradyrhizobium japonicum TaxID=375 RepID=UPI000462A134|nr:SGNH/GDSL hydrolase family protein [Bradyrhizobium japonicum]
MNVFDIAIHGTSLTVDRNARNWPIIWEKSMQVGRVSRIKTYLTGREGQASGYGLANIQPVVNLRPRAAVLEWINDANPAQGVSISQAASNWTAMVAAIRSGSPNTSIYFMLASQPRADAIAATFPNLAGYDARIRSLAITLGVQLIDVRTAWGDPVLHPEEYAVDDGIHPLLSGLQRVTMPLMTATFGPLIP